MPSNKLPALLSVMIALSSCSPSLPKDVAAVYEQLNSPPDYNTDVKPVLSDKCFPCHGPDQNKRKAGLRLDLRDAAYGALPESPGKVAIYPGSLMKSEVFKRIISDNAEYRMPTPSSHLSLTAKEKAILVKWIEEGAVYKPHWAFVKPIRPEVPAISDKSWRSINPIDNFVCKKLEQEKLQPSREAEKAILLRRLSLDLTGLPPTLNELDDFEKDNSSNAYEKQVDRLLASPHYGEKMAVDWLDVARYADSHGYTVDRLRDMSPYRDWVINSFNNNMPYSTFIEWQLAGDLMPHPTKDMIIATAFNRNHPQNMEGGIIEEEFQTEYVIDRTNTFGSAFMGLTVGCAKCHDHKFDPLTQKNYYELFSFFNNVKEAGQISFDDALPTPTLMLPTPEKERIVEYIKSRIQDREQNISKAAAGSEPAFDKWLSANNYRRLAAEKVPREGLQAWYTFDNSSLKDALGKNPDAVMKRETGQPGDPPVFVAGVHDKGLSLNGDTWLDLNKAGLFRKADPFSIALWVNIPSSLKEGVIFHKCSAERLYNFKGYHLYLRNNKLELTMAHTAPSNAISRISKEDVPRDTWIQVTMTYDGSSGAAGMKLFINGSELPMETTMDQLTKDILFNGAGPGLQIGAWWRGNGFKGGKVDNIMVYGRVLTPFEIGILAGKNTWTSITSKKAQELDNTDRQVLKDYFLAVADKDILREEDSLHRLRLSLADTMENIKELMVMQEMPHPKKTCLLRRGNYDMPGEEVFPNTPASILPMDKKLPRSRLGLAQWLLDKDHPLTARVAVNRLWQNFFGVGLVKTSEDFGNQGEMPANPALLDWLAVDFRESGWDIRRLNKLIVMSATYRQDSHEAKGLHERDPANRLLSHGPSNRLSAEMIRDNALMASGLLNPKIGGESVKPYQPAGLWEINNTSYKADTGDAVYRRSIYIVIKRSVPNPTLASFDAPSRSSCIVRRQQTNTPLQALVTLNDPTFVEASRVLAEYMCGISDDRLAITGAYRKLTAVLPNKKELDLLLTVRADEYKKFREHPEKMSGWLTSGNHRGKTQDAAMTAANAVVASMIMNSDAALTKR